MYGAQKLESPFARSQSRCRMRACHSVRPPPSDPDPDPPDPAASSSSCLMMGPYSGAFRADSIVMKRARGSLTRDWPRGTRSRHFMPWPLRGKVRGGDSGEEGVRGSLTRDWPRGTRSRHRMPWPLQRGRGGGDGAGSFRCMRRQLRFGVERGR